MNVVELYPSNYRDIPATLRVIADQIDDGTFDPKRCAVVMLETDGNMEVFGLGDLEAMDSGFLLQMGIQHLVEHVRRFYASQDGE